MTNLSTRPITEQELKQRSDQRTNKLRLITEHLHQHGGCFVSITPSGCLGTLWIEDGILWRSLESHYVLMENGSRLFERPWLSNTNIPGLWIDAAPVDTSPDTNDNFNFLTGTLVWIPQQLRSV